MIPISVIVVTKNEGARIARCLKALKDFDDVIVVDSDSTDNTVAIAQEHGARSFNFLWNGQYPKKRQWCLDHLDIKHDFVFFVDADEVVTDDLIRDLKNIDYTCAGYFIKGQYIWHSKPLKHGLYNNKLALINRHKIQFPVVDDLNAPGMGEIEGHYQPVLKSAYKHKPIGQIKAPLLHYACETMESWQKRHERYAAWEVYMNKHDAWPKDPVKNRQKLKEMFRTLPYRDIIAFLHSYILKQGFRDGEAGLSFARSRYHYYNMIKKLTNA